MFYTKVTFDDLYTTIMYARESYYTELIDANMDTYMDSIEILINKGYVDPCSVVSVDTVIYNKLLMLSNGR